jgi:mRNA-decapping enzyme 1B
MAAEANRKAANLRFLQRLDSSIVDILGSAKETVLYKWDDVTQTWEQCDVEGILYVVERDVGAGTEDDGVQYQFVISNRSKVENIVTPIKAKDLQMQLRPPFLIYRYCNRDTRGIWMNDEDERNAIYELVQKLMSDQQEQKPQTTRIKSQKVVVAKQQTTNVLSQSQQAATNNTPRKKGSSKKKQQPRTTPSSSTAPPPTDEVAAAAALLSPLSLSGAGPAAANGSNAASPNPISTEGMVLEKKNLQLTLLSLVQDERFMDLIHAQYVKIAQARASSANSDNK